MKYVIIIISYKSYYHSCHIRIAHGSSLFNVRNSDFTFGRILMRMQ